MKKKLVSKMLIAALACTTLLSGCGSDSKPAGGQEASTQAGGDVDVKGTELTFFYYDGVRVYKEDYPLWKAIQENTGLKIKGVAPTTPGGDVNEQFNLMIASGEIPDIIWTTKVNVLKYNSRLLLPLEDLIEQYAPNLKAALEARPDVLAASKGADGHIYFIPFLPDGEVSETLFIRKDWLDKFNLPVPTTTEEYLDALRTFRDKDANGNGKKDEIGFFDRTTNMNGIASVFNLFGATLLEPYVEDGVVIDDRYAPEFKEAVKSAAGMYAEGLIDPEFFTRGKDAREIMFNSNIGASTVDWAASTAKYQATYEGQIEGLDWEIMLPVGPEGKTPFIQFSRPQIYDGGWGISKDSKNAVAAIKLFDYMFSEEGSRIMNFGIEGETYDMVDGKPKFKDSVLNGESPVNDQMKNLGWLQVGFPQDFEYEKQWTSENALKGIEMYMDKANFKTLISALSLSLTPEEQDIVSKYGPNLTSYTNEMIQKWVLGSEDIDASFDAYLAKIKDLGGDEVLKQYQAAYDRAFK